MARSARRLRQRGSVDELPSKALRVRVYAGKDPVSKRRLYLTEVIPAGPKAAALAEQARARLLNQVDEKRNPRTRATVNQLLDKWLAVVDVDASTKRGYVLKANKHIRPLIGAMSLTDLDVETLDSLYAELRRCRDHCDGRPFVQHRTTKNHVCDEHRGDGCAPADMTTCRSCKRACRLHVCRGLADSTIRQVHWVISGALDRAVVWRWISLNPAEHADKPPLPHPEPDPPSAEEAARLVRTAWEGSPEWGAFVWTKMTTGSRRGEMCALRWSHLRLDSKLLTIKRTIYEDDSGRLHEKDTKTHQQRRLVLDSETTSVLLDLRSRAVHQAKALGTSFEVDNFVFPGTPDGRTPLRPSTATQRYKRMADRLGIDTTLKALRHYSATELIHAGVDVRTVAGRLGHGGGGATTLRVYTAWSAEADQRAASTVSGRMPSRPGALSPEAGLVEDGPVDLPDSAPLHLKIAADLRAAIRTGVLDAGDPLPPEKVLAARYDVASSTAHRAVAVLVAEGLATASRGKRALVAGPVREVAPELAAIQHLPGS